MDYHPQGPDRPDPLITVEPAPFASEAGNDPGWAHARHIAPFRVVAPGECPHRVRVRDLKASRKIVFLLAALPVYGSALLSLVGMPFGGLMVGMGAADSDLTMLVVGAVMAALAAALVFGFVACVRVWRRLHRPGLLVCVLSSAVLPLALFFGGALAFGFSLPWLLVAAPPVAPMIVLWYFRAVLHPRETCANYPWLPLKILAMLKG